MHRTIPALVLGTALLFWGCSSDQVSKDEIRRNGGDTSRQTSTQSKTYLIQEGDQVQLSVAGYPEFSTTTFVKQTGTITVPLVGEVEAVKMTRDRLMDALSLKLGEYVKSKVFITLNIVPANTQKVIVIGSVSRQGPFDLNAPMSLIELLANVGGLSESVDLRRVKIYRNGEIADVVDVDMSGYATTEPPESGTYPLVYPGDIVYFPRQENFVRDLADFLRDVLFVVGIFSIAR